MEVGKRVYYELLTGNIFLITPEMKGEGILQPTPEQDKALYLALADKNEDAYSFIDLEYGQYTQDFMECNGFRVDLTGEPTLVFSYPDPAEPEAPPVYQKPLTEKVAELEIQNNELMLAVAELAVTSEQDKIETQLAIAELATIVTGGIA
ncbi:MAG: hypothetical protein ACE3L7_07150 [Candidatus Pristimantibacillus sp.]